MNALTQALRAALPTLLFFAVPFLIAWASMRVRRAYAEQSRRPEGVSPLVRTLEEIRRHMVHEPTDTDTGAGRRR